MIRLLSLYQEALLHGFRVTLALTGIVWFCGLFLGTALGSFVTRRPAPRSAVKMCVAVVAAIPVLVLLMWFHYPAQTMLGIVVDPFTTAAFVLSLANTLLVADAVASAALAIPEDWRLMARACGLTEAQTTLRIILPLSIRQLLGSLVLIQVGMLQATLFASLISVDELFRVIETINSREYDPVQLYTFLALFFFVICAPLQWLAALADRHFSKDLSPR